MAAAITVRRHPSWVRTVGYLVAFCAAGLLGRLTVFGSEQLALVWPAAGVGALWLLGAQRAALPVDAVLLALATLSTNALTGVPLDASMVLMGSNLLQSLLVALLLRRWSVAVGSVVAHPDVGDTAAVGRMLLASALATVAAAVLGTLGMGLLGAPATVTGAGLWWGRNLCGMVVLLPLVALVSEHARREPGARPVVPAGRRPELASLVALTLALYILGTFVVEGLAFPLLAVTIWVGLRFSPLVAAVHSAACGVAIVLATLADHGPFVRLPTESQAILFAQVFVIMVMTTALALAIIREERAHVTRRLVASEHEAAGRADVLRTVLESMHEGVMVVEGPGRITYENAASATMRGRDLPDPPPITILRPDGTEMPEEEQPITVALSGTPVQSVDLVRRVGGRDRTLSVSATPVESDAGRQVVVVYHDVTADRTARAELDAFAGAVAHDLRNPLAVVEGWAEALTQQFVAAVQPGGEPVSPVEALRMLARIEGSAARMQTLIADLLDHATAGHRDLELHQLDLRTLAHEVAVHRQASDRVAIGELPPVRGDVVLLRQLLDNLIGNALTYVAPGVEPRVTVSGERAGDRVVVRVADNGIGIDPADAERIFERFQRAHADQYAGTGLGLAICRRIVDRHGGTILARPGDDGVGSVVEFTLPAHRSTPAGVPRVTV